MDVTRPKLEVAFDFAVEVGWLLALLLTPLWVNLWGAHPFDLAKATLVRSIVGALLALALAATIVLGRGYWMRLNSQVFGSVLVLTTTLIAAAGLADAPMLSLWGSVERGQGLLTLLSYLGLFLIIVARCRCVCQRQRLLLAPVLATTILSAIAITQALGWQTLPLVSDARSEVFATLGRANFLATYIAMVLPITLALCLTVQSRAGKIATLLLLVSMVVVLMQTQARSGWLAATVGMAVFLLLWQRQRIATHRKTLLWCALIVVATLGLLGGVWLGATETGSPAARLTIWRGVLQLIGERPWLGYGPDTLFLHFSHIFPPELVYYQGRQFYVDRAHNWLLDWAITAGLAGLLAYVTMLLLWVHYSRKTLGQEQDASERVVHCAAIAAVAANLMNNLTSFDVTATATIAWVCMGLVMGRRSDAVSLQPDSPPQVRRSAWRLAAATLAFVGILGPTLWWNVRLIWADTAARRTQVFAQMGAQEQAVGWAARATSAWPVEPYYWMLAGHSQEALAYVAAEPVVWLQQAEASYATAITLRPGDFRSWLEIARFYTDAHRQFGLASWEQADAAFATAVARAPNISRLYAAWGEATLVSQGAEQALPLLQRATSLDATDVGIRLMQGYVELELGLADQALISFESVIERQPDWRDGHVGLANALWRSGKHGEAYAVFEKATALDSKMNPENTSTQIFQNRMRKNNFIKEVHHDDAHLVAHGNSGDSDFAGNRAMGRHGRRSAGCACHAIVCAGYTECRRTCGNCRGNCCNFHSHLLSRTLDFKCR